MSGDGVLLRPVEIADLRTILRELDDFWGERDETRGHARMLARDADRAFSARGSRG